VAVVGLFIPGSPILIAVGAVVGLGHLPLWPMLVWATAGAIIGDGVSFELGRRYRATILGVWPVSRYPAVVARGETFFRRHGGKSIALGRFLPMLRPMIPMVAGALGLRPGLFYAVNIASAIVWAPAHILGGALLGASLGALGAVSGRLVAMLAVLAVALLVLILSHPLALAPADAAAGLGAAGPASLGHGPRQPRRPAAGPAGRPGGAGFAHHGAAGRRGPDPGSPASSTC
jgi:membrane protein DedA with SNARE-associated domain